MTNIDYEFIYKMVAYNFKGVGTVERNENYSG